MSVLDLCRKRCSVRKFTGDPLSVPDLDYLKEVGRWAATSRNRQARRFVVVHERENLRGLVEEAKMQDFVESAGALVFGIAEDDSSGSKLDVVISLTQMEMAAVEQGLGTIWLGIWDKEIVRRRLKIPGEMAPVVALAIGKPAEMGSPRKKLPVEDLFRSETF